MTKQEQLTRVNDRISSLQQKLLDATKLKLQVFTDKLTEATALKERLEAES